ncbi:cell division ATP-binding protein FtsE [Lapidilactobacillus concavus DSM 17758]|uniref:Cell division ATP-binding protein FtsE n=1 Tax=Lapidilactobacillus concavus DSM 17758 TaxID=1423735 RepID=A0A0R1VTP8_9LACO|nr:cell division ATP-binding protein FtsE [Lapidilactobacillus concavus]KRM09136.1 cell division ATP-binding protein FtsE [Lapidilactobacillus concavus DSM 17758]GEL13790.1 cell division ATP-binding protein FtsE [Lapidilactobacillus concavus]
MIKLLNVTKRYSNGVEALKNVSLTIEQGEFVYLVGQSGAGKSTLVKLLYRQLVPTEGFITINNFDLRLMRERQVPKLRRTLGVVFQDFKLLPKMTVSENIGYALQVIGKSDEEIKTAVTQVLAEVGLSDQADHFPDELSGGQQQRVAIARAIINDPKTLIADEPTGNLDPQTSNDIMAILERINARGTTVIMATHNQQIVDELPHRLVEVANGTIIRDEQGGQYTHELDNDSQPSTR